MSETTGINEERLGSTQHYILARLLDLLDLLFLLQPLDLLLGQLWRSGIKRKDDLNDAADNITRYPNGLGM
jgi:hypothetical protein